MRIVAGRWFREIEPQPVFVINESLARRYFAGGDPIGKRFQVGGAPGAADATFATVIGVVADLRSTKLDAPSEPEIFGDYTQGAPFAATLLVRTSGDPMALASAARGRVVDIDKMQEVSDITTVEQSLSESIAPRRFNVFLFGTFASAALLLALVGIYGVIAYSVAQRTQEIGVRIALGAERRTIVRMVVGQGMTIAAAGLLVGILVCARGYQSHDHAVVRSHSERSGDLSDGRLRVERSGAGSLLRSRSQGGSRRSARRLAARVIPRTGSRRHRAWPDRAEPEGDLKGIRLGLPNGVKAAARNWYSVRPGAC
jgi:hypothetical protein